MLCLNLVRKGRWGIKTDNQPENLAVLKHGEHRQLVLPFQSRIRELELAIEKLINDK